METLKVLRAAVHTELVVAGARVRQVKMVVQIQIGLLMVV
jgi:hypothetical protein